MSVYTDSKYLNLISSQLRNFAKKKDDLWNFSCPICGDSKKDLKKARGYVYRAPNHNALLYKCHNCNASTSFAVLLEKVNPTLYDEYCTEKFLNTGAGHRRFNSPTEPRKSRQYQETERQVAREATVPEAICVTDLDKDDPCRRYVASRMIPEKAQSRLYYVDNFAAFVSQLTNLYIDSKIPSDARLVIPFFDREGTLTMFQGRSLDPNCSDAMRYMTVKLHPEKEKLFGLERVKLSETVYVTEGPIDSLFLPNAVATADSALDRATHLFSNTVLVFDNEPRNRELCKTMQKAIERGATVVIWETTNRNKDINDMILKGRRSIESVMKEINKNTCSGLEAMLRFGDWRKV